MHKGVDFAAPTGTPIFAAGNGVVEFAGKMEVTVIIFVFVMIELIKLLTPT